MSSTGKPSFDPLPNVQLNQVLPPFKAWVQMAIPTVFDDSLSYAELLYKVINYLNVTNDNLTTNNETIKAFKDFLYGTDGTGKTDGLYHDIVTWFDNLQVDATLEAKVQSIMDEWVTDNTLLNLISPTVVNTTTNTTTEWLEENIQPETGYVIDNTLSVANAAGNAKTIGDAFKNGGFTFFEHIYNRAIASTGTGYSGQNVNAILYEFIPLIKSTSNKINIYTNKSGNLRYSIVNGRTTDSYITTNLITNFSGSYTIDYSSQISQSSDIYLRVSLITSSPIDISTETTTLMFAYDNGIIGVLNSKINEAEKNIEENIEPLKSNSGLPAYDKISNNRLSISGTPSTTYSTFAILYSYIKLPKNSNSIIVYPTITAGQINYAISKEKNINSENIVDTGTTQNMRVPLVIDYSSLYTDSVANLYLIIHIFNPNITFDPSKDKTALLFMYDKGVLPNLIYGDSDTNANTAVNLLYNEFDVLVDSRDGFGITHIKNMGHNTRTYVYVTNNNKTTVQNFVANSDTTSPITIQAGHRYVFTKKLLYRRTLSNITYDINAYYIEDLNDGVLKCGYLNNASADVPNDITWRDMGGGSNTINNTFNNTYNSYNTQYTGDINVSPQITTDTNNLLNPSGNDDTASILAMLQTGVCILNKGTFRISGLNMPPNSTLIGQGNSTVLIWHEYESETPTNRYMIQLGRKCTVSNLRINALNKPYTTTSDTEYNPFYSSGDTIIEEKTIGDFNAIQFQPYGSTSAPAYPANCVLNNLYISNCKGSGLKMYNTGTSPVRSLIANNITFHRCDCAINSNENTEFHKISNFSIEECYYGCKVLGGNVEFNFGTIYRCFYSIFLDASQINDSHGCFTDVRVVHTANVYGEAQYTAPFGGKLLFLRNFTHGEKFNGCTFGYGSVDINACEGAKFYSCGFSHAGINITNAIGAIFSNCAKSNDVTVNNVGSTNTKLVNCFDRVGGDWTLT